eukprot:14614518-Alexandrium_andersonii.AAC.1
MAPPCRGLRGWAALSSVVEREAWLRSLRLSVPLGRLCGAVARSQLGAGAHFLVEQPAGSALLRLSEWAELGRHYDVAAA